MIEELRPRRSLERAETALKTFGEAKAVFLKRLANEKLKEQSKDYRRETIGHLEKGWPRLAERGLAKITEDDCMEVLIDDLGAGYDSELTKAKAAEIAERRIGKPGKVRRTSSCQGSTSFVGHGGFSFREWSSRTSFRMPSDQSGM